MGRFMTFDKEVVCLRNHTEGLCVNYITFSILIIDYISFAAVKYIFKQ